MLMIYYYLRIQIAIIYYLKMNIQMEEKRNGKGKEYTMNGSVLFEREYLNRKK